MTDNIASLVGAVTREVRSVERDGREARVVVASRAYDTTIEDMWDAITNPERIPRWFLPVTGELRLGGQYQLVGNASGTITGCEPPRHLALTWEFGGEVTWVEVHLAPDPNGGTHLVLEHSAHVDDARWDQFGPGAVGVGWDLGLLGLHWHISGGSPLDTMALQEWEVSEDAKQYSRQSSEGWRRASIAWGTDESAATAAADRTTAFYTGEGMEEPAADTAAGELAASGEPTDGQPADDGSNQDSATTA